MNTIQKNSNNQLFIQTDFIDTSDGSQDLVLYRYNRTNIKGCCWITSVGLI
jgi:hypothetical protein